MPTVLIIGAGPAGSLAAFLLARAGFSVELFEQQAFPRDKVCGECLSALGIGVLARAGLDHQLGQLSPVKLTRSLLHPLNGPSIEVALPQTMWGLTRRAMDVALLDAAVAAGATLHQPARCERIVESPAYNQGPQPNNRSEHRTSNITHRTLKETAAAGLSLLRRSMSSVRCSMFASDLRRKPVTRTNTRRPVSLVWRDLSTNITTETFADWILVADGKGSLLGRSPAATGDLGIKTHFENVNGPRDAIELFAGHGHYGGLAAVEGNRWNAAFSIPFARVRRHSGDLQKLFDEVVSEIPVLAERLCGARRVSPWLASPLPRFPVARRWSDGVIPLGNAAAALEPVGGEGMGLALRSAELAVQAILASALHGDDAELDRLPGRFRELWTLRRTVCRGIARLFSNPSLADAVAPLMVANPRVSSKIMDWAGKTSAESDRFGSAEAVFNQMHLQLLLHEHKP